MIHQDLLKLLVCPVCKQRVVLTEAGDGLRCANCRKIYPIRDGIPVMLIDQAVPEP